MWIALEYGHLWEMAGAWVEWNYEIESIHSEVIKSIDIALGEFSFSVGAGINGGPSSEGAVFWQKLLEMVVSLAAISFMFRGTGSYLPASSIHKSHPIHPSCSS